MDFGSSHCLSGRQFQRGRTQDASEVIQFRWWPLCHQLTCHRSKNRRLLVIGGSRYLRTTAITATAIPLRYTSFRKYVPHTTRNHLHYFKKYVFLPFNWTVCALYLNRISQGAWNRYFVDVIFELSSIPDILGGRMVEYQLLIRSGLRRYERRPSNSRWKLAGYLILTIRRVWMRSNMKRSAKKNHFVSKRTNLKFLLDNTREQRYVSFLIMWL